MQPHPQEEAGQLAQAQPTEAQPSQIAPTKPQHDPEIVANIHKLPSELNGVKRALFAASDAFLEGFNDPQQGKTLFSREMNFAAQALLANKYLLDCGTNHPNDLINAIKNISITGTTLNPVLKQAYLVPFNGRITLMTSYMGLVDILINSGLVEKVEAHAVFEEDEFEIKHGTGGYIRHKVSPWGKRTPETLKGCYYYIKLAGGGELFDTLSKEEIEDIKRRSPSVAKGKSSPWDTDYIEMAKKTALRRGFKMCPKTGISDEKLKVVEAAMEYDTKVDRAAGRTDISIKRRDTFDEEATYEDI